jgi:thymidylate synthase
MTKYNERQYLNLVRTVLKHGHVMPARNGDCISMFGANMRLSLDGGVLPLLTTKKMAWRTCLRELLWFIRGDTDNASLQRRNVHIWDANATREFQRSRNLEHYREGVLGPVYGWQWRNFGGEYDQHPARVDLTTERGERDQLATIVAALERTPEDAARENNANRLLCGRSPVEHRYSRRLVMSAWNPAQITQMVLPPCHIMAQFMVDADDGLHLSVYQRSADIGLGVPFNIASYGMLAHLVAHHCGLTAKTLYHTFGVAHIYSNHVSKLKVQAERKILPPPRLHIADSYGSIDDYQESDFVLEGYEHHPVVKMPMTA